MLTSGVNFKDLAIELRAKQGDMPALTLNYGAFINNVLTFMIVAWAVFMLVKTMNVAETRLRLGTEPAEDTPPPPEEVLLLRQIRDELKKA